MFDLGIRNCKAEVHQSGIPMRRNQAIASALNDMSVLDDGFPHQRLTTLRLDYSAKSCWVGSFQRAGHAHEGATRADPRYPAMNWAPKLFQNFRPGSGLMRGDALGRVELIDIKAAFIAGDPRGLVCGGGNIRARDLPRRSIDLRDPLPPGCRNSAFATIRPGPL